MDETIAINFATDAINSLKVGDLQAAAEELRWALLHVETAQKIADEKEAA